MATVLVNADDFGLHRDIDRGILDCIEAGVVQSISFSPQGQSLDWNKLRELRRAGVRIGLHVTLVGEPWLIDERVIPGWKQLVKLLISPTEAGSAMRRDVAREVEAQVARCIEQQMVLSHIDSHQHVHAFAGVWQPVLAAAQRHGISRVRVPWCPSWRIIKKNIGGVALQILSGRLGKRVGRFLPIVGLAHAGHNSLEIYQREFDCVSDIDVELCAHPGQSSADLRARYREWNFDWDAERQALLDPRFREILHRRGYTLAPLLPSPNGKSASAAVA